MRLSDERFTLLGMLVVGYLSFLVWFCGWPIPSGLPISESEAEEFRKSFEGTGIKDEMMSIDFEDLMQNDDGATVAIALQLKFRDDLQYPSSVPEGFEPAESLDAALSTLGYSSMTLMFQHGVTPVSIMNQHGSIIRSVAQNAMDDEDEEDGSVDVGGGGSSNWDQLWIIRVRSRRDLLNVLLDFQASPLYTHRLGAIEKLEAAVLTNASTTLFSVDLICNLLVLLLNILVFLASEACFPGPPKLKEEKKPKKKISKKDTKDGKDGKDGKDSAKKSKKDGDAVQKKEK